MLLERKPQIPLCVFYTFSIGKLVYYYAMRVLDENRENVDRVLKKVVSLGRKTQTGKEKDKDEGEEEGIDKKGEGEKALEEEFKRGNVEVEKENVVIKLELKRMFKRNDIHS